MELNTSVVLSLLVLVSGIYNRILIDLVTYMHLLLQCILCVLISDGGPVRVDLCRGGLVRTSLRTQGATSVTGPLRLSGGFKRKCLTILMVLRSQSRRKVGAIN